MVWEINITTLGNFPWMCRIFITHVRNCVMGATPMDHDYISQSKKEDKDQESIQSSTTPDPGYQRERNSLTIRHDKRKPRGSALSQQ